MHDKKNIRGTTVICIIRDGKVAMAADGQVTLGNTVMKSGARKIRRIYEDKVLVGFAGATADAITLVDKFETKLGEYSGNITRAAVELAKEWRTNKMLRNLEAMVIVASAEKQFLISGSGDVIEPEDGVIAIGSGGPFARAAATAMIQYTKLGASKIAENALKIAASICIYTNDKIIMEEL
ncbi:MAG: ATP-dependent protease subunit HslV [Oligoflexia bacterium]|nr:ATP-dependent protease subunit HslV [Oligoflexia bacterium]